MRFDLANRQAFLNSKLHQRFRIGRTQRRARVSRRDLAITNILSSACWQLQQAQGVCDVNPTFADACGKTVLSSTEALHQRLIGFSFFNWVEVCALNILDDADLE